jgi:hypothetical protein
MAAWRRSSEEISASNGSVYLYIRSQSRAEAMSDVISIRPQLLCGKLSRELGRYIENDPGASPAEMLELCNQIFAEIGAVQVDGVWTLPDETGGKP